MEILIEYGAEIKLCESELLSEACNNGNIEMLKFLIDNGADINSGDPYSLCIACHNGSEPVIKFLIENGAKVNGNEHDPRLPLIEACGNKIDNEKIIKYLVEHGADPNKKDKNGATALWNACIHSNEIIIKYLIDHGADVNSIIDIKFDKYETYHYDNSGIWYFDHLKKWKEADKSLKQVRITALAEVCKNGNEKLIKYLVSKGANINETVYLDPEDQHETSLSIATEKGYGKIINYH